ncbi:hypothetical protein [Dethiosulfatarculus sandiegensis]|uniref:Uncharacterized protein n=1 Tax=Dethiosulfatarculus sandiegensis TaxID=1429043 RepID=A0A0D2JEJ9_9BACT|nr:hypothetical protein [Dethiosulfatarculus sandiegensis]KIX14056.1 hypothetical protein X474_10505 [Dethiosulfatarculus sandiegensis]
MLIPERPWKITRTMADEVCKTKDAYVWSDLAKVLPHLLYESQQTDVFRAPEAIQVLQAKDLFKQILAGEFKPLLELTAKELGFSCQRLETKQGVWLIITETKGKACGKGFFLFNMEALQAPCLQLPHSFKDWYTGELGLYLALEGSFSVVSWNTYPRRTRKQTEPCDLAHLENSFFTALALAYSQVNPQGKVIQLHSFVNGFRKTSQGEKADLILSSGLREPEKWFSKQADAIKKALPGYVVKAFPKEVGELGGTQNTIGRALNQSGQGRFLHLEMANRLRIDLLDKKDFRKNLNLSFKAAD